MQRGRRWPWSDCPAGRSAAAGAAPKRAHAAGGGGRLGWSGLGLGKGRTERRASRTRTRTGSLRSRYIRLSSYCQNHSPAPLSPGSNMDGSGKKSGATCTSSKKPRLTCRPCLRARGSRTASRSAGTGARECCIQPSRPARQHAHTPTLPRHHSVKARRAGGGARVRVRDPPDQHLALERAENQHAESRLRRRRQSGAGVRAASPAPRPRSQAGRSAAPRARRAGAGGGARAAARAS